MNPLPPHPPPCPQKMCSSAGGRWSAVRHLVSLCQQGAAQCSQGARGGQVCTRSRQHSALIVQGNCPNLQEKASNPKDMVQVALQAGALADKEEQICLWSSSWMLNIEKNTSQSYWVPGIPGSDVWKTFRYLGAVLEKNYAPSFNFI